MYKRLAILIVFVTCCLTLPLPVSAQDQQAVEAAEFDIELIIFRPLAPDDSEAPVFRIEEEDPEAPEIERRRYQPLAIEQLRLGAVSDKLLNSKGWSPILHYGWRQPVLGREDAPSVPIAGNRRGAYATGDIRVTVERFLRLELDLHMDPGTGIAYHMDQSRRVRSGQLHYFDHPQFGVLILVSRPE